MRFKIIAGSLAAAGLLATGCASTPKTSGTPLATPTTARSTTTAPTTPPAPVYHTPTASDFELTVKILSKQCFGSAGCNVSYKIKLGYDLSKPLDPDITYELTYKVTGDESGPQINTLTVTGDQYTSNGEEFASTPTSGTKLRVTVVSVEEQ